MCCSDVQARVLFTPVCPPQIDAIFGALRNEAKASGVLVDQFVEMVSSYPQAGALQRSADTLPLPFNDFQLKYFIGRVRSNLHLILCFSPVGDAFRVRARRFPGLINCSSIDRCECWQHKRNGS